MKTFTELLNTINYEIGNALSVVDSQALENFCTLILHARRIFIAEKGVPDCRCAVLPCG
jgi:DNA-binding MurR/RpiR family transcriptional regulator